MPVFIYKAMDKDGNEVKGELEAPSQEDAINAIRSKKLYPTNVKIKAEKGKRSATTAVEMTAGKKTFGGRVKGKELTLFTRQLSILQDAGLPLVRSLQILEGQSPPGTLKNVLMDVIEDVKGGSSLSDAFAKHPRVFDKLFSNMVKAGEVGGVLDVILRRLAEFMEKSEKMKKAVVGAMIYPACVVGAAVLILYVIMIKVIPTFQEMFEGMKGGKDALPGPTKLLMAISDSLAFPGGLIYPLFIVALVLAYKATRKNPAGELYLDKLKFKIPIFGLINKKSTVSRFCRTLGTLVASGVPILEALSILKDSTGNAVMGGAINSVHDSIREGDTIAEPLQASGLFEPMVINMIEVGEETGELDKMLSRVADIYDDDVDNLVKGLMSAFEPILIIGMGVTVGFIVLALFMPLVKIMEGQMT